MRNQKLRPSKLKVVKRPKHWGKRLDQFRLENNLSIRDFAGVCENKIGKTTVHRICSGGLEPRLEGLVKPIIADSVRTFLRNKGKTDIEIEREICAIFSERHKEAPPMFTHRTVLSRPAQEFFKLSMDPFTGDPLDISQVFTTQKLDVCLAHIMESVKFQGFNALVGEVGAGKTIIKRRAVDVCNRSNGKLRLLWPEFMNMEKVQAGSIASFVLRQFSSESVPNDLVKRAERLKRLLVALTNKGVKIALGFDECHHLDPRLLTALKNFWELGDGGFDRYIGLVLFGQLSFQETLNDPLFREISERLNVIKVPTLGRSAADYLAHRLKFAGGKLDRLFQPAAVVRMTKLADTPQALGNVANAALESAFSKSSKTVLPEFVPQPIGDPEVRSVRPHASGGNS